MRECAYCKNITIGPVTCGFCGAPGPGFQDYPGLSPRISLITVPAAPNRTDTP